jgi:hypothetical protein
MRAVIVYESMFGSTRMIAEAIGEGMGPGNEVQVVRVTDADVHVLDGADLVVVGGPTHVHGMTRPSTRRGAPDYARKPGSDLVLEPGVATGPGVREWLASLAPVHALGAAFDTRIQAPPVVSGRASKGIDRELARHGLIQAASPESFIVNKQSHLVPGEQERARSWGAHLATLVEHPELTPV